MNVRATSLEKYTKQFLLVVCLILNGVCLLSQQKLPGAGLRSSNKSNAAGNITVTTQVANASCELNNGSITVIASGGVPPYRFAIDNGSYSNLGLFFNLGTATYTLHVTDANGQPASTQITITNTSFNPRVEVLSKTDPSHCTTCDGSVTLKGTAGVPPFTFSLDGVNFQADSTFKNQCSGFPFYEIKDANGCIGSIPVGIGANDCQVDYALQGTSALCNTGGTILATARTGVFSMPPFQYSLDGIHYQSDGLFTGLPAGIKNVYITDAGHDTTIAVYILPDECPVVLTATAINPPCNNPGNSTAGSIIADVQNGTPPYSYTIDGSHFQNSNRFDNLDTGRWTVLVKDAKGNLDTASARIVQCLSMTVEPVDASCGHSDGRITVHASGGTEPYQYAIDGTNYQSSNTFLNVKPGNYTVTTKSADGSVVQSETVISSPGGAVIQNITTTPASCSGNDGTLTIVAAGGTLPLQYGLDADSYQSSATFSHLQEGEHYQGWVKDANGCTTQKGFYTIGLNCIRATTDTKSTTCGQSNGRIAATVTEGTPPYRYSIDGINYQSSNEFENLGAGDYILTIKDNSGLTQNFPVTVTAIIPNARVFAGNDTAVLSGFPFQLQATDVNQSGFTNFQWSPAAGLNNPAIASPVATISKQTRYTVTAYTPDGCTSADDILIKTFAGPDIYVPSAFSPNHDGLNDVVKALPIGIESFQYFTIYDRFGQRLFYTTRASEGWDGNRNEKEQNAGTYIWAAAGIDINHHLVVRKGTIVLIR